MKNLENYNEAYAEVIEVLNYIPLADYKKIPKNYITYMEENCDENCSFVYNIALPFEKQNISDTAKNILGMIFRLFIITQDKKDELNVKDKEVIKKKAEEEKQIKYNPDNLFKRNNINTDYENIKEKAQENVALIEVNDSIFKKIWNKMKSLLKK